MKNLVRKSWSTGVVAALLLLIFFTAVSPLLAGDPAGTNTGTINDVTAKDKGKPTLEEIGKELGHTKTAVNFVWMLVAGFLVMFMQAGFALAETGFCRAKNAAHTMAMNFMVYGIGMLGYWVCGYALQMGGLGGVAALGNGTAVQDGLYKITLFGKDFGLFGYKGFFLSGSTYDAAVFGLFLFSMVFMDTAATIPTGAMAERWKWTSFILFSFVISMLIYPIYGCWVWGGGWLSALGANFKLGHGYVDYAGSSVVHMVGGVCALAGAWILGPRIGKYNKNGEPVAMPGHSFPMAVLGVFILAFGWFGFNAGSSLAGTDLRIAVIATNTMLASAAGAFVSMLVAWMKYGKPDPALAANGMLAGLVAITAPCAFVNSVFAVVIGAMAGVLLVYSVSFFERTAKIDDPVGAISVHGVNGAWGILSLGLFADGSYGDGYNTISGGVRGLFYGDSSQFFAQVIGCAANVIWVFCAAFVALKIIGMVLGGNRVPAEAELQGLDIVDMGIPAYPDYVTIDSSSSKVSVQPTSAVSRAVPDFLTVEETGH